MNYPETCRFLFDQLPMYQRSGRAAYKADLDNTHELDKHFGHPHRNYSTIHVAGTNGKGSVSHILASVLQESGLKCGLYTSPHLLDFRERIRVNGKPIPEEEVVAFVKDNATFISNLRPSFFEMTVAMAFRHFADEEVDLAVIETGMGGRLDSTNILQPLLSVITNISMDHSEFLGNNIPAIAAEKGGIIKEKTPLVLGKMDPEAEKVLLKTAGENEAPLLLAREEYQAQYATLLQEGGQLVRFMSRDGEIVSHACGLLGHYQHENLATALTALEILSREYRISKSALARGLSRVIENTSLLGRWQILGANPRSVCDTGHNEAGVQAVVEQIRQTPHKNLHIVWGMVSDKSADKILPLLPDNASYYFTRSKMPRAMDEKKLLKAALGMGLKGQAFSSVEKAYEAALEAAGPDDMIFTGGSTFVVADLLGSR